MTDAQKAAIDRLDERFGGHERLLDEWLPIITLRFHMSSKGWFGRPNPYVFIHIEPDGSTHS